MKYNVVQCCDNVVLDGGEDMEVMTIRDFADDQKVSYEAIRKQVAFYADDLKGHIVKKNRKQFLDEYAVEFLKKRRREHPVVITNYEKTEENEDLKKQLESVKAQLMTMQHDLIMSQQKIIELQEERQTMIEDQAKYTALLEDNQEKDRKLQEAEKRIRTAEGQAAAAESKVVEIQNQATSQLQSYWEENQRLQMERDAAMAEAQSYTRSIFGLYRKK